MVVSFSPVRSLDVSPECQARGAVRGSGLPFSAPPSSTYMYITQSMADAEVGLVFITSSHSLAKLPLEMGQFMQGMLSQ